MIMNFIVEILPKRENASVFVYVVRNQNGFPIAVCESLEGAKDVIQENLDKMLAARSESHSKS